MEELARYFAFSMPDLYPSDDLHTKGQKLRQLLQKLDLDQPKYIETSKGYRFVYPYHTLLLEWVQQFVESERQCCGFLHFDIRERKREILLTLEANRTNIVEIKKWLLEIMVPQLTGKENRN